MRFINCHFWQWKEKEEKMKKVLCTILAVCAINSNALAATNISVSSNRITAEIDIDAGKWGTLIVTKSGKSLDNENIIAMKQALADENGKATFSFSMPVTLEGGVNGKYDLHIKNGDGNVYIENMYYFLPEDRESVVENIKNSTDIKAVLEDESNKEVLKSLGVYLDIYNDFKEMDMQNENTEMTDSVCKIFTEARAEDMSDAEVIDLLNKTLVIQAINVLSDKNVELIEKLGYSFENVKYIDATNDTKNFVCEYIYSNKPYMGVAEVKKVYEVANMLNVINSTRFNDMGSKITGYAQDLGIEQETVYKKYAKVSNKSAVNEDIAAALKKKNVVSVAELLTVIDKATKDNAKSESTGGGSGGGGGTINTPPNPIATVPVVNNNREFGDIDDAIWAKTAITAMAKKGIIVGDEKGNVNPNNAVKREEFVKMLVVAAGMYKQDAKCAFDDVLDGAWYSSYVASAYNNNMVYGTSETSFGVGTNITRQDMAVMCYRAAKNLNKIGKVRDSVQFADEENISEYAKEAVAALYEAGAINGIGDNLFSPTGTATRAQAAVIIYNLFVR